MLVFVYGTLKRGGSNHGFLAGQRFVGEARTSAGFTLYALNGYPGLVAAAGALGVTGEVWDVTRDCLSRLDDLEGVDEGLYTREPILLAPPWETATVETYVYRRSLEGRRLLGETWRE